ncbi:ComEA family DNA-binding protein [Lonsdalea populi]|uniref:ComEA family DNA-binding protein n=1 Tax=Lonsdalea populi TaxID=1172565 RepID=UPI000A1FEDBC|nr:helix-hairpin-helix domain-containing protein [Lonsdalea populi]OSM99148.1 competence protein ComEA [Lonsdalea populi]QPQ25116.1 helix-hairpin-helix domain-containing protein [Lonsdalea populi]RAT40548.1 competence protein ComEA [Lonsdalea populi]RAT44320.1 competence protein ComEA [Lonsdalea populi]RAT52628.1 competence protein ComEA [Lonsdalea populi]
MKKSGIKAMCFIVGLTLSSLPALVQAATKVGTEKTAATLQQDAAGKKLEQAIPSASDEEKVSINSASAEELADILNGVGLKKAQAIVSYREQNGPFTQVDQLQEVPGIGASLIERNQARLRL